MRPFSFPRMEGKSPWLLSKSEREGSEGCEETGGAGREGARVGERDGEHGVKAWTRWMARLCVEGGREPWEGPQNTH